MSAISLVCFPQTSLRLRSFELLPKITLNEYDAYGHLLHSITRTSSGRNSLWVPKPGARKGKYLLLRPNPYSLSFQEKGPGYTFANVSLPRPGISSQYVWHTSTEKLTAFAGYSASRNLHVNYDDVRDAVAKWYSKAASFSTNVAEIYATRKQTIEMVGSLVNRIAQAAGYCKRRKWRAVCSTLGITYKRPRRGTNPPEAWLEYNYGWVPLLSDIYLLLDIPFPEPHKVVKVRTRVNRSSLYTQPNGALRDAQYQASVTGHVTISGKVTITGTALAAISSYGLTNPASLAWELLPFSFVVDWMVPIGPYLEQMSALGGCVISDQSTTTTSSLTGVGNARIYTSATWSNPTFVCRDYSHVKTRVLGFSNNPFPRLKKPLSIQHFSLALSLLATNISDMKKKAY